MDIDSVFGSPKSSPAGYPEFQPYQDYFGLNAVIQTEARSLFPSNPPLADEFERLFGTTPPALPRPRYRSRFLSGSLGSSSDLSDDDFATNGRDSELDELDLISTNLRKEGRFRSALTRPVRQQYPHNQYQPVMITKSQLVQRLQENERPRNNNTKLFVSKNNSTSSPTKSVCVFCRNNGEDEKIFSSHQLKDASGRVTCPVLRDYTCPLCQASGDVAHTIKYCPKNSNPEMTTVRALKTARTSTGKKRVL